MRYVQRHKFVSIVLVIISVFIYINFTRLIQPNPYVDKKSDRYINDIYFSDERIYNTYLNEKQKIAYDELLKMFKDRQERKIIDLSKFDNEPAEDVGGYFLTATEAIMVDHPELMDFSTAGYKYKDNELTVIIRLATHNQLLEEINTLKIRRIIDNIRIKTKDMSDLEKIKYVYEWIGENSEYDRMFTYTSKNQSIYNVFIKKNAVCAGFAKTSQVIFQNIGIESMTVLGTSTDLHMWNIIKIDGKYYYYDSTYAASINDKNNKRFYNGLKQTELNYYTQNNSWYPEIEQTNIFVEEAD